jgi:hypothetical protein
VNEEAVAHWGLLRQKRAILFNEWAVGWTKQFQLPALSKFLFIMQTDRVWGEPAYGFIWV